MRVLAVLALILVGVLGWVGIEALNYGICRKVVHGSPAYCLFFY